MMDPRKMNLKTLKDIEKELEFGFNFGMERMLILKQEAIKRVKSCKKPVDFTRSDRCGKSLDKFPYNYCEICQREIWFNNLTEEDLK